MARTRSFWGSQEFVQGGGSLDITIEEVLAVRANTVYRLTGYRMGLRSRTDSGTLADGDHNFTLALTVWDPSTAMTPASSFDSKRTLVGLFPLPGKGTIDAMQKSEGHILTTAVGLAVTGQGIDSGWVVCDLVIPSLVLTGVSELIGNGAVWQFGVVTEYETKRVGADEAASIAKQWGVPKPHETTW